MGLRFKILSGFLILALMLAVAGFWSIFELRSSGSSLHLVLDQNFRSIHAAAEMNQALEREDSAILLLLLGRWEEGRKMLSTADSLFQARLAFAYSNITEPGEQALLDTIRHRYDNYQQLWERPIVDTPHEGNIEWYMTEVHQVFLKVKAAVNDLSTLNSTTMYQSASELKKHASRTVIPGIIALLAALLFTLIFNYFVNYYVVSPIIRITRSVNRFIDHKTPYDVSIESHDEIADLSQSIWKLGQFLQGKENRV